MELKLMEKNLPFIDVFLLIVPYGIETDVGHGVLPLRAHF